MAGDRLGHTHASADTREHELRIDEIFLERVDKARAAWTRRISLPSVMTSPRVSIVPRLAP